MAQQSASARLSQVNEATDWCSEARRILAYPEDLGMARRQLRGLRQLLARRETAIGTCSTPMMERRAV